MPRHTAPTITVRPPWLPAPPAMTQSHASVLLYHDGQEMDLRMRQYQAARKHAEAILEQIEDDPECEALVAEWRARLAKQ
jgi:hypothetical protein